MTPEQQKLLTWALSCTAQESWLFTPCVRDLCAIIRELHAENQHLVISIERLCAAIEETHQAIHLRKINPP